LGLLVALAIGFAFLASGAIFRLLWGGGYGPGGGGRHWSGPPVALLILAVLGVAFLAGRAVRRMAAPVGEVMEAADRVAGGDYSTRGQGGGAGRGMAARVGEGMEAADRVAGGDYSTRVQVRGPGEVGRLAHSFNQMTERLQANETQRRALLADVAHELRTPLSVIRGNVEGMLDGVYPPDEDHLGPLLEETAFMARLVHELHTLSPAEAAVLPLHPERVPPAALATDAVATFRARADRAGVALTCQAPGPVPEVDVDPLRIGEVLANRLTHAIRHTAAGGAVRVVVEPDAAGGAGAG